MEKPGRNDPCPCGSGKKYKRCCSGREEERATYLGAIQREALPLLTELVRFAEQGGRASLEAVAAQAFPFWLGPLTKARAARVVDYLVFDDGPQRGGHRVVDEFLLARGPGLEESARRTIEAWSSAAYRPYEVCDWSGGFIACADVLAEDAAAIPVCALQSATPIPAGIVVARRALPNADSAFCVGEPLGVGLRKRADVAQAIRLRHHDFVRNKRIVLIDEFLRLEPTALDQEAASPPARSTIILPGAM